ncbi:MAG: YceI family protein [Deltaproteobacteria bacterium]|nr:YceI family protein [Deltaproteobacteria bacterium]
MTLIRTTLAVAAAAALSLVSLAPSSAQADTWTIDAAHSHVGFKVRHLAVSWVRGDFSKVEATIDYDGKDLTKLSAEVTIDIASISTENSKRDEHLKSPDFFDAANHPTMTFKSKKVVNVGADGTSFDLVGDLTMRGTTKEVTLNVTDWVSGVVDPWGNTKSGATAKTTVNRTEYGLEWNNVLETGGLVVGEDVTIELELELNKSK